MLVELSVVEQRYRDELVSVYGAAGQPLELELADLRKVRRKSQNMTSPSAPTPERREVPLRDVLAVLFRDTHYDFSGRGIDAGTGAVISTAQKDLIHWMLTGEGADRAGQKSTRSYLLDPLKEEVYGTLCRLEILRQYPEFNRVIKTPLGKPMGQNLPKTVVDERYLNDWLEELEHQFPSVQDHFIEIDRLPEEQRAQGNAVVKALETSLPHIMAHASDPTLTMHRIGGSVLPTPLSTGEDYCLDEQAK